MNAIAWVIVSLVHVGYAFGPEFNTESKCEAAVKVIVKKMNNSYYKSPTCVRIEK